MIAGKRWAALLVTVVAACLLIVLLTSCSEKASGTRRPNIPPEAFIAFGPAEDSLTYYKAQVFWYGADSDGSVEYFLVKTVRDMDPSHWESLDGWTETPSKESTFVFVADSCCTKIGSIRSALSPWGVLVRAVDNDGAVSEIPAQLFFVANNVLPKVEIVVPQRITGGNDLTARPYFQWRGEDPDGDVAELNYKYLVIPIDQPGQPNFRHPDLSYEDDRGGYVAPEVGKWSQWVPADCTSVRDLDLELYKPKAGTETKFLRMYVTVRDEGGAVLPDSLYGRYNGERNWLEFFVISTGTGVPIVIDGGSLGTRVSTEPGKASLVAGVFVGSEISFRFWGNESRSQGKIAEAYRYYWDSPSDPASSWNFWSGVEPLRVRGRVPEWFVRFPADGSTFPPLLGRHILYVEVRDVNFTDTRCLFRLEVLPGPSVLTERKILFVDDNEARWLEPVWVDYERSEDAFWNDVLDGYDVEVVDTGNRYADRDVDIRLVNSATTVIWDVDDIGLVDEETDLYDVSAERGNYLKSYVDVGGNLIIIGQAPVVSTMYWPDGSIWIGTNNESGADLRRQLPPTQRQQMDSWDFTPLDPSVTGASDSLFNWNWEIFGIKRMSYSQVPARPFNAIIPTAGFLPEFSETLMAIEPPVRTFPGDFGNAPYITRLRDDIDVRPLFTGGYYDSTKGTWANYGGGWLLGVYVPASGSRGNAAYLNVPAYWFDHDKVKALIRHLLTEFGEEPLES
jgi:hypothetical protein